MNKYMANSNDFYTVGASMSLPITISSHSGTFFLFGLYTYRRLKDCSRSSGCEDIGNKRRIWARAIGVCLNLWFKLIIFVFDLEIA